ncbi:hypothetical protein D3C72_2101970 [compost metagenome]
MGIELHRIEVAVVDLGPALRVERGIEAGAGERGGTHHGRNVPRREPGDTRRQPCLGIGAVSGVEALQGIGALGVAAGRPAHPVPVPFHLDPRPGLEPGVFEGQRIGQSHVSSGSRR